MMPQEISQLQNARAIRDTVKIIADTTEGDSALKSFSGDVFGYLSDHFIVLQRLTTLGVKISPEPSEYEILLQCLHILTCNKVYDVADAMEDSRIYNRDVLSRIYTSLEDARNLLEEVAAQKANHKEYGKCTK